VKVGKGGYSAAVARGLNLETNGVLCSEMPEESREKNAGGGSHGGWRQHGMGLGGHTRISSR